MLTGMADAVLSEICARLAEFAESGATAIIELTAMPLTAQDRAQLEERLGHGEVTVQIESAGRSDVWETAFAGVWFVRHFGEGDRVATESIEIASVPAILQSHRADARAAARRLGTLCAGSPAPAPHGAETGAAHTPFGA
jgi:hydrogenase-1 operon protein HyaF